MGPGGSEELVSSRRISVLEGWVGAVAGGLRTPLIMGFLEMRVAVMGR